ncbi:MAG: LpxD N-terminal domain-containing protein, partial [Myxococcota bacterium]|nr:LpxD N-terminal domain-containing protein [Myxococcota bacterium]
MRLSELAERLGGRPVEGDPSRELTGVASLEEAGPGDLGFVRSERHAAALPASRAGALVAPEGLDVGGRPVLRSPSPSLDFARAAALLTPRPAPPPGRHPAAVVADDAQVDPDASLGPGAVVGPHSRVGARSRLHANVTVAEDVVIGEDCEL